MTTQEVWDHHVGGFVARDIAMVLEDYTEESTLIDTGTVYKGIAGVTEWFTQLFKDLPKDCAFDLTSCIVMGKYVYITWNASSDTMVYEFATDTFVVENGKIFLQTIGCVKRPK